jgi:hypothetical protein
MTGAAAAGVAAAAAGAQSAGASAGTGIGGGGDPMSDDTVATASAHTSPSAVDELGKLLDRKPAANTPPRQHFTTPQIAVPSRLHRLRADALTPVAGCQAASPATFVPERSPNLEASELDAPDKRRFEHQARAPTTTILDFNPCEALPSHRPILALGVSVGAYTHYEIAMFSAAQPRHVAKAAGRSAGPASAARFEQSHRRKQ